VTIELADTGLPHYVTYLEVGYYNYLSELFIHYEKVCNDTRDMDYHGYYTAGKITVSAYIDRPRFNANNNT